LYRNELVIACGRDRSWRVDFGSDAAWVGSRVLYVPNLFTLHRPLFRLAWDYEGCHPAAPTTLAWIDGAFRLGKIAPVVYVIAFAQCICLPYALLQDKRDLVIILTICTLYGLIIFALIIGYRETKGQIERSKYAIVAFECLVCPPLALNLVRKLSLVWKGPPVDGLNLAEQLLPADAWRDAAVHAVSKIQEEIDFEAEGSDRSIRLITQRDKLLAVSSDR
jgi:hypothetical protein